MGGKIDMNTYKTCNNFLYKKFPKHAHNNKQVNAHTRYSVQIEVEITYYFYYKLAYVKNFHNINTLINYLVDVDVFVTFFTLKLVYVSLYYCKVGLSSIIFGLLPREHNTYTI